MESCVCKESSETLVINVKYKDFIASLESRKRPDRLAPLKILYKLSFNPSSSRPSYKRLFRQRNKVFSISSCGFSDSMIGIIKSETIASFLSY